MIVAEKGGLHTPHALNDLDDMAGTCTARKDPVKFTRPSLALRHTLCTACPA